MPELVIASEDVQDLVREVIAEHFGPDSPRVWPIGKRVIAVFRLDKWETKGRLVKGKYQKLNDLTKALSDPDLWEEDAEDDMQPHAAVILNQEVWKSYAVGPIGEEAATAELALKHRKALIHHELCYQFDKADVEEFLDVIQEHGLWTPALKSLGATVATQLELPLGIGPRADPDAQAERRAKLKSLFSSLGFDEDAVETLIDATEECDAAMTALDRREASSKGRAEAALDAAFEGAGIADACREFAEDVRASGTTVTLEHAGRTVTLGDPAANAARTKAEKAAAAADPEDDAPFDEEGDAP